MHAMLIVLEDHTLSAVRVEKTWAVTVEDRLSATTPQTITLTDHEMALCVAQAIDEGSVDEQSVVRAVMERLDEELRFCVY